MGDDVGGDVIVGAFECSFATYTPFGASFYLAAAVLSVVHADVCGGVFAGAYAVP